MKKLEQEDPVNFRAIMHDLEFDGNPPMWHELEVASMLKETSSTDITKLRNFKIKLDSEKAKLAAEVIRVQNLLKIQNDIEKQNSALHQTELDSLNQQIRRLNHRQSELQEKISNCNSLILTYQKQLGPQNPQQLKEYNDMLDRMQKEQEEDTKLLQELQKEGE